MTTLLKLHLAFGVGLIVGALLSWGVIRWPTGIALWKNWVLLALGGACYWVGKYLILGHL